MTSVKGYALKGEYGNIRAGKYDYQFRPKPSPAPGKYGVMLMHQAGSLYLGQGAQSLTPMSSALCAAVARHGYPVLAGEINGSVGGDGFGNPSTRVDMDAGRVLQGGRFPTINAAKLHFITFSMGTHGALEYALEHPDRVASITSIVGLTDIIRAYDDVPAQQAPMRTAWGVADRAGLVASGANIYARLNELDVPTRFYYSRADTTIAYTTQTGAAAAMGPEAQAIEVSTVLNHTDAEQIAKLVRDRGAGSWSEVLDFIDANQP